MNITPSSAVNVARCSCMTSSFRWPLTKSTHGTPSVTANRCTAATNLSVILAKRQLLRSARGEVLMHDVVLPLALDEIDPRNALGHGEPLHRGDEPVGESRQRRCRGDR